MSTARAAESRRQQALLAALAVRGPATAELVLCESAARALQGLGAYRVNASAIAERALGAVFPQVVTMIGTEDFEHLAREFWLAQPPERGDLGEWGDSFPAWLETHSAFTTWPYLGDAARLDLALHCCERAADAEVDAASLALLSEAEPTQLRLQLMPGTTLIESRWPIATIHAAHHGAEDGFDAVRDALARDLGECVLVARQGWRAVVHRIDGAATARWTACLLAGADLNTALTQAGDDFDFSAWLGLALQQKWLKGAARIDDQTAQPLPGEPR